MWPRLMGAVLLVSAAVAGVALLLDGPGWFAPPDSAPRLVAPRGELAPAEETVIALFEATKPSVVSITTRVTPPG